MCHCSVFQSLKGYHIVQIDGEYYATGEVFNTADCTGIGWSFSDKGGDCNPLAGGSHDHAG